MTPKILISTLSYKFWNWNLGISFNSNKIVRNLWMFHKGVKNKVCIWIKVDNKMVWTYLGLPHIANTVKRVPFFPMNGQRKSGWWGEKEHRPTVVVLRARAVVVVWRRRKSLSSYTVILPAFFSWLLISESIICCNDELSWTMSWVGCLLKD